MKKELADLINNQVNFEIYSAHIYLNMACYCGAEGLEGFRNWMNIQYQEEMSHANKLIDYLLDNGYTPKITNWEESPGTDYTNILEVAQISLMHEKVVTERFNYMMTKAHELGDYATINLLNWFIDEQVEEEASFEAMIQKINMVKDAGLYLLDQEYGARTFVDNTKE
ncbi:ferritin [Erysipelotrichaceae bacterium OttesenSCG-928-M19]|nr:ferritin [Erysipelotrichaceae bacterium OttesenSCG-928-M19]